MLVLTRKESEMIRIGEDVFIKVIRTGRSTVKIGIQAPATVRVLRAELCENSRCAKQGDVIDVDSPEPNWGALDDEELEPPTARCSDQFPCPCFA